MRAGGMAAYGRGGRHYAVGVTGGDGPMRVYWSPDARELGRRVGFGALITGLTAGFLLLWRLFRRLRRR